MGFDSLRNELRYVELNRLSFTCCTSNSLYKTLAHHRVLLRYRIGADDFGSAAAPADSVLSVCDSARSELVSVQYSAVA